MLSEQIAKIGKIPLYLLNIEYRNEVLHGGELLKIRGLCRNKQAQSAASMNESSSLNYTPTDPGCEKSVYDQHTDRIAGSAIIKESPVIVTSPQHLGSTSATHKPSSSSSSSSSSSTSTSGPIICPTDQEMSKRVIVEWPVLLSFGHFLLKRIL